MLALKNHLAPRLTYRVPLSAARLSISLLVDCCLLFGLFRSDTSLVPSFPLAKPFPRHLLFHVLRNRSEGRKLLSEGGRAMSEDPGWWAHKPNLPSQVLEKAAARSIFLRLTLLFLIKKTIQPT